MGNSWTISWNALGIVVNYPIFGVGLAYSLSTLVGHLTLPHVGPDIIGIWVWIRISAGLLPILGTLLLLAWHPQAQNIDDAAKKFAKNKLWYGILLWIVCGLGLLNGVFLLPQHV
jgi:hypothetical protein